MTERRVPIGRNLTVVIDARGHRRLERGPSSQAASAVASPIAPALQEAPTMADISLTPTQQVLATAKGFDADGNELPSAKFNFSGSDLTVADVVDNGDNTAMVVAHAGGSITISATDAAGSGISATAAVDIAAALASVTISLGTPEEQPAPAPALDSAAIDFGQPTDQAGADASATDAAAADATAADQPAA